MTFNQHAKHETHAGFSLTAPLPAPFPLPLRPSCSLSPCFPALSRLHLQGSGWAWLGYNKGTKRLEIAACANQDPLSTAGLVPLLGFDVWEVRRISNNIV